MKHIPRHQDADDLKRIRKSGEFSVLLSYFTQLLALGYHSSVLSVDFKERPFCFKWVPIICGRFGYGLRMNTKCPLIFEAKGIYLSTILYVIIIWHQHESMCNGAETVQNICGTKHILICMP